VAVLHVSNPFDRAGGAANVALNLAELGSTAALLSLLGDDDAGRILTRQLTDRCVRVEAVTADRFPTIQKIRCVSKRHQLLRADFEQTPTEAHVAALVDRFGALVPSHGLVILSDYAKGALSQCELIIDAARAAQVPVLVDPKGTHYERYRGALLIKPNLAEFTAVVGPFSGDGAFHAKATDLRHALNLPYLIVTQGEAGMTLFGDDGAHHEASWVREVYDVSGAGDTVLATIAHLLARGASMKEAMQWANRAAGIVVGKFGTATVTPAELGLADRTAFSFDRTPHE
jgi:rfaE bifunctional protein kinase chain/domain